MKEKVTAAVVIINSRGDILGCHATGRPDYTGFDFPKGIVEKGESHIDGALRELREETGIILKREDLIDCGQHSHNKEKDIHIFMYQTEQMPDINKLVCSTYFEIRNNRRAPLIDDEQNNDTVKLPEVNKYEIIPKTEREKFNRVLQNKFELIDSINENNYIL